MQLDRSIRRLVNIFMLLFLVVSGWLVYWQVFWQGTPQGKAVAANYDPRQCVADAIPQRGSIYDRNGVQLAFSVPDNTAPCGWRRHYTDPTLAPLIGYFDPTGFGITGLELAYNDVLSGAKTQGAPQGLVGPVQVVKSIAANAEHRRAFGTDVYLTIDAKLQDQVYSYFNNPVQYCSSALDAQRNQGSIVVEDPHSGELLAMVSHPDYNNDQLVDHTPVNPDDPTSPTVGQAYWSQLVANSDSPLLDRPVDTAILPGSSFKTLTLIAAYDTHTYTPQSTFTQDEASSYTVNGFPITTNNLGDYSNEAASSTFPMDVSHTYAYSDNVAFARMAVKTGKDAWLHYAQEFGISYGSHIINVPFDVPVVHSWAFKSSDQATFDQDNVLLANMGYGQGSLLVSPLVMTTMVSAVAADGQYYAPHLELKTANHLQSPVLVPPPAPVTVMSADTAHGVRQAMRAVTVYGSVGNSGASIGRAATSPVLEAGKTGTGQLGSGYAQTWFISLAPDNVDVNGNTVQVPTFANKPADYAVVVQKDRDGEGACQAPIALRVYEQLLLPGLTNGG